MTDISDIKSPERTEKIDRALRRRQPTLTVVLENIHDPHNVNAILRSCDAVGVLGIHLLYYIESFPKLAPGSSSGAYKWVDYERHSNVRDCFEKLRGNGFQIVATRIDENAKSIYDCDLTKPTAFVLGNEHRGISDEVIERADRTIYIPMMGMAESLNVSVASAVCLFEAFRQRQEAGMYNEPQLSPDMLGLKRLEWLLK